LEALLRADEDIKIKYEVKSTNGKSAITFKSQRDLVVEFLKVLSLAHECVPETINKPDGSKYTFY
jgi:hypothetical protein